MTAMSELVFVGESSLFSHFQMAFYGVFFIRSLTYNFARAEKVGKAGFFVSCFTCSCNFREPDHQISVVLIIEIRIRTCKDQKPGVLNEWH